MNFVPVSEQHDAVAVDTVAAVEVALLLSQPQYPPEALVDLLQWLIQPEAWADQWLRHCPQVALRALSHMQERFVVAAAVAAADACSSF